MALDIGRPFLHPEGDAACFPEWHNDTTKMIITEEAFPVQRVRVVHLEPEITNQRPLARQ